MVKLITEEIKENALISGWLACTDLHDFGCEYHTFLRFLKVAKGVYKYYIPFHIIPFLLFKLKQVKKKPTATILRALSHYIGSVLFMAGFNAVLVYCQCKFKHLFGKMTIWGPIFGAFISAWTCLLETESRRTEICLFILPRFLETFWSYLKHRELAKPFFGGENLMLALAMGTIVYYYHKEEKAIKPSYRQVLAKFLGKN